MAPPFGPRTSIARCVEVGTTLASRVDRPRDTEVPTREPNGCACDTTTRNPRPGDSEVAGAATRVSPPLGVGCAARVLGDTWFPNISNNGTAKTASPMTTAAPRSSIEFPTAAKKDSDRGPNRLFRLRHEAIAAAIGNAIQLRSSRNESPMTALRTLRARQAALRTAWMLVLFERAMLSQLLS